MNTDFPQYRRYLNGKNYFRIDSPDSFEEIRSLGNSWSLEQHKAKILPDFQLIHDLLVDYEKIAEIIAKEIYQSIRDLAT